MRPEREAVRGELDRHEPLRRERDKRDVRLPEVLHALEQRVLVGGPRRGRSLLGR